LTGEVVTSHLEHLRLAKTQWDLKDTGENKEKQRSARYAARPMSSRDSSTSEYDSADEEFPEEERMSPRFPIDRRQKPEHEQDAENEETAPDHPRQSLQGPDGERQEEDSYLSDTRSEMASEDVALDGYSSDEDMPLARLVNRAKRQRENSTDEEDIPLEELRKRLKMRDERTEEIADV